MTIVDDDHKGWIFLFHPHTNNGFFLFSHHVEQHLLWKEHKKASRNPEFAEMRHGDVILTLQ